MTAKKTQGAAGAAIDARDFNDAGTGRSFTAGKPIENTEPGEIELPRGRPAPPRRFEPSRADHRRRSGRRLTLFPARDRTDPPVPPAFTGEHPWVR